MKLLGSGGGPKYTLFSIEFLIKMSVEILELWGLEINDILVRILNIKNMLSIYMLLGRGASTDSLAP